jgi:hypothetical protein
MGGVQPPLLKQLHERLTAMSASALLDKSIRPAASSALESFVRLCLSTDPEARPTFTDIVKSLDAYSDALKSRPKLPDGFGAIFEIVQKSANQLLAPLDDSASASIEGDVKRLDFDSGKWVPRFLVIDRDRRQLNEFKR